MAKILIKNGRVWDGERFFCADVLINNRIISSIEPDINEDADYIYDATDKIVSAGLIDIHTHMLGSFGINAEMSCIPFGVTAAADASAEPESKEKYNNFLVKNKVFVCAEFSDNRVKYENMEKMLAYYKEEAVGIKVYFDTNISNVKDISPLREIVEFAHKNNLIVMVHSSNSPTSMNEIVSALEKGDILTHTYHGGENSAAEDVYNCLKKAKEKGIVLDVGFAGNVHTDFGVLEEAIKEGCMPDTISTDITKYSAYKRGGRYGITMCMSIAKKLGMSEEDVFRSVTTNPAKALGMEKDWGHLMVGRCADISVFDYCKEEYSLTDKSGNRVFDNEGYRCALTVIDGKVAFRD